jgi:hypothetical protein
MKSKNILAVLSFSLLLILVWSCGELEKGSFPTNAPPQVYLVNVPVEDASFSINPRVYWWGTDADGQIVEYQYLVIPESKDSLGKIEDLGLIKKDASGLVDSLFVKSIEEIPHTQWVDSLIAKQLNIPRDSLMAVIDTQTSPNIMMFADLDTVKYVSQYFFVRGVDNDGSVSKIWKPGMKGGHTFRRLARNNHPPNTHIDTIDFVKTRIYYSLPETTETWKGMKIEWEGSDSSDYPTKQPDFFYQWELFGPFADTLGIDPMSANPGAIVDSSWDSVANTRWIPKTSRTFVNLKNYDEENGGSYGWYLFRVKSRDDAFVEDGTPDYVFIQIVHPLITFWPDNQRTVLAVDASKYGRAKSFGAPQKEEGRTEVLFIYENLLSSIAGEVGMTYDIWFDSLTSAVSEHTPPSELVLSKYKLVIVLNHGPSSGIEGTGEDLGYIKYKEYLDVGGNVWFVGMNNFKASEKGWHSTSSGDKFSSFYNRFLRANLARNYFGLDKIYYPKWDSGDRNDEFIGAKPFLETTLNLPYLESDSAKVDTLLGWIRIPDFIVEPLANAVPYVGTIVISVGTERLYDFVSLTGMHSELNGKPCASRFVGTGFKTAEFCFPLYIVDEDGAMELMKIMINWFLEPTAL